MEPLVQILGLFLMMLAFLSGGFLFAVQPVWGIVDVAVSQRLSTGAKVTIILLTMLLLGPVMTFFYALTQPGAFRKTTVIAVVLFGVSVAGVLTMAALTPQDVDSGEVHQAAVDDVDATDGVRLTSGNSRHDPPAPSVP